MTTILKGAQVVEAMNARTASAAAELRARGIEPTLAIFRVGKREDAIAYERGAIKRCEKVAVSCRRVVLPEDAGQSQIMSSLQALNLDDSVHGILMLRPLPAHIDDNAARNGLLAQKDIDGISDISIAGLYTGAHGGFAPCTAQACVEILDFYGIPIAGKRAVVVGRSLVIGRPVAMMLLDRNATVTVCHSHTKNIAEVVRAADIVIGCVGRAKMITAEYLRAGQTVIDVGINVAADGSLVGDVSFDCANGLVDAVTPVPGGVGAVTTSVLAQHVIEAAKGR